MASAPEWLGTEWPYVPFFPGVTIRCRLTKLVKAELNIGRIALIEVHTLSVSRVHAPIFGSHTARDQFSVLKYTHSSPNVYRVD